MRGHADKIVLGKVSQHIYLIESFIIEFQDMLKWKKQSQFQKLSPSFIPEHYHILDMTLLSKHQQHQDMESIENLKEKLGMKMIFHYQDLSENFVLKHMEATKEGNIRNSLVLNKNNSANVINAVYRQWMLHYIRVICQKLSQDKTCLKRKKKIEINKSILIT